MPITKQVKINFFFFKKIKAITSKKERKFKGNLINKRFYVDVYIPSLNLIIEADGNYWHALDRVVKKDKAENAYLTKCGYNILRLNETEINNCNFIKKLQVLQKGGD